MDPKELRFSREHEWVGLVDGDVVLIGISDFAQDELGDIVFLGLPEAGEQIKQSEKMGEIESVKAVSDLYSPISGEVLEANAKLADNPEKVNEDPYGEGWLLRVRMGDPAELDNLMTYDEYQRMLEETD